MKLSYSVLKTMFINIKDDAFESNIPTKQAVKELLSNHEWLTNYVSVIKEELDDEKLTHENYSKDALFHFLLPNSQKFIDSYQKSFDELSQYLIEMKGN